MFWLEKWVREPSTLLHVNMYQAFLESLLKHFIFYLRNQHSVGFFYIMKISC